VILARVLLVRGWTQELAPVVATLQAAGVEPAITQIDREPALNAALSRDRFDVIIVDPATMSRSIIEQCLRANGRALPIVEVCADLGAEVRRALQRDKV